MQKFITILKYIIIGIVQGISEILPISSSGHLALCYYYFNIEETIQLDLTIFLHFASSLALIIFFKEKLISLIKGFFSYIFKKKKDNQEDFKLVLCLGIASFPIAFFGFFIKPFIEKIFTNISFILIGFIITAIILCFFSIIKDKKTINYNFKSALITGFFQTFSIFPAISRSAITMFGAKIEKLEKKKEFTFLLLIPISIGSFILSFIDMIHNQIVFNDNILLYFIAMITSFIFTFASLKFIFKKTNYVKPYYYSIYLILLSLINIIILLKKS